MTAHEIEALLTKKYAAPVHALFFQVANGTGAHQASYADALAYNLFPSSGHKIEGFEIKISRSDWLRELKQPEKAGYVMQYCDQWWLVAPKGVAFVEELPKSWGFYEIVNGKFYCRRRAPELKPIAPDLSFIAALLRRSTEGVVSKSVLWDREKLARQEEREACAEEIKRAKGEVESLEARVAEWEKASGLKVFGDYMHGSKEIGAAVRWVLDGNLNRALEYNTREAIDHVKTILGELHRFENVQKTLPDLKKEYN